MSAIFTLSIACVGGMYLTEEYRFVMDFPEDSTLAQLASDILGVVDFDGDHMSAFYLANGLRGKKTWFTADGEWDDDDSRMLAMPLSEIFPLAKNKKLYYTYDAGASWLFEIRKQGKSSLPLAGLEYPRIVSQEGKKPSEYGPDADGDSW